MTPKQMEPFEKKMLTWCDRAVAAAGGKYVATITLRPEEFYEYLRAVQLSRRTLESLLSSARDFISEGGSFRMIGAPELVGQIDRLLRKDSPYVTCVDCGREDCLPGQDVDLMPGTDFGDFWICRRCQSE